MNKSNDIKSTIVKKHGEPLQQENILFGLNKEQRKFYMKNKLNIELKTKTSGSAYGWSSAVAYSGETSTKWEAYRGFDKISEEKFFRLTGYPDEAKLAKVFHSKSNKIGWCGCITGILGVLSFYIGGNAAYEEAYEFESGSPEREKLLDAGDKFNMYGLFISLSGTMLSLYGIMRLDQNWTAYSTVHGIANEYNNKLLQKISNK